MELEMKLLGYVISIVICSLALYFSTIFFKGKRPIKGILALVFIPVFIYMVYFFDWDATNGGSYTKCTICGKKADTTFQGSGYCTKHYKDAVIWTAEKAWEKDND